MPPFPVPVRGMMMAHVRKKYGPKMRIDNLSTGTRSCMQASLVSLRSIEASVINEEKESTHRMKRIKKS